MAATQRQLAEALYEMLIGVREEKRGEIITSFIGEVRSRGLLTDGDRFLSAFEDILRNREDTDQLRVTLAHGMTVPGAETRVDASLIGGAVAERRGRRADASIRGRLRSLRQTLGTHR